MRLQRLIVPALALALLSAVQDRPAASRADLEGRVKLLETRLLQVEGHLQAQAVSAQAVSKALDEAVKEGFTAGINPRSREILVEAWKSQAQSAGKGLQAARPAASTQRIDPRLERRKRR